VVFDPPPCWRHLPVEEQRRRAAAVVREIKEEARIRREATGKKPEFWEAYATFVAAYRDAAEKFRAGGPDPPHFPAGS
jgi:hypothetical protein